MEAICLPTTKAQQRAVNKCIKSNYDRLNITLPAGQKSAIQATAEQAGESVNLFTQGALLQRMGL